MECAPKPSQLLGRRLHQQADLPVAGVIAERDRRAIGGAHAALRAEIKNCLRPSSLGFQPMPASSDQPNKSPLGDSRRSFSVRGNLPEAPAAVVTTSKMAGSSVSRRDVDMAVVFDLEEK